MCVSSYLTLHYSDTMLSSSNCRCVKIKLDKKQLKLSYKTLA